jgi:murein DD-endopeptidase MepM/ murein hydrolase activator NlpD
MTDGVAAVLARMQQLDGQLRTFDPSWTGISGASSGSAAVPWGAATSFGQALVAAGTAEGNVADASATTAAGAASATTAAGAASASAAGSAAAGGSVTAATTPGIAAAVLAASVQEAGTIAASAATSTTPADPTIATTGVATPNAAAATAAASLAPSWVVSAAVARRIAQQARAARASGSGTRQTTAVSSVADHGTLSTKVGNAVAAGQGIGEGIAFSLPVKGARVSQNFGPSNLAIEPVTTSNGVRYAHFHQGIDYAAPEGTPVLASADGVVVLAGRVSDGAVDVKIRHASGVETLYGHLQVNLKVHVGQKIKAGQQVGQVGMTGHTNGPHLHFTLRRGGVFLDPSPLLEEGYLPGVGKGASSTDGAGTAAGAGGPNLAAFDAVAGEIPYAKEIRAAAVAAGIDPLLLASMVKFESGFRSDAVSRCGAMGLCQLMPATARGLGVKDPFDPVQNLRGGARYLAANLHLYGRADLALAAYQAGRGAVDRAGGMPASSTTRNYAAGIIRRWNYWLKEGSA